MAVSVTSVGILGDSFISGINPNLWTTPTYPTNGSLGTAVTSTVATTWASSPSLYGSSFSGSTEIPSFMCTATGNDTNGISSITTYDLTGSGFWFEFVSFTTNSSNHQGFVSISSGSLSDSFFFNFQNANGLYVNDPVNGQELVASFTAASSRFLRIRESGGTVYYDTSADSITWSNATTATYSFGITAMTVSIYSTGPSAGTCTLAIANLNPVF